ncbi:hypothetical protein [Actinoplanes couchii]|uniref:Uncharacterized protein n=1 Tax=Actinoplanes couchii TaxID=403638 RepID=A0ABQ3XK81_9ACTN|nr:hypothetical protein [Actinoplanes couchii]MDR6320498.1 hypothetical protein [Actinoplanes couchii]GID58902.1 hypothetical protein Aco03nite_073060 [Actinoplanes couchii]
MTAVERYQPELREFLLAAGPSFIATAGLIANIIQIVTVGSVTTAGLVAFGFAVTATLALTGANLVSRGRKDAKAADELEVVRTALAAFAAYRPYREELIIVFDVGTDQIEEHHVTTALQQGNVVSWCNLEPVTRGPIQKSLDWDDLHLDVYRPGNSSGTARRAVPIRLPGRSNPALILFAPPSASVEWNADYLSPSFWDPLRRDHAQRFEWTPPAVGPDEPPGRRSPVRMVTFRFRVPATLGTLDEPLKPLPDGVTFRRDPTGMHEYTIENTAGLPGDAGSPFKPIILSLKLIPREAAT